MWRIGLDTIGLGIVIVMLVTLMFAVLIMQRQRSQKTIVLWLGAGFVGLLLGSAVTLGALRLSGYNQASKLAAASAAGGEAASASSPSGSMGASMGSGMGGSGMGGGGMGGGGMGGPNPKRDLTVLVRKIDLLTGDIGLKLSPEQSKSVSTALADVEKADEMSDEDAQAKHDEILALFDDGQKSQLDGVGLPRPQRGAGGGGPGGPPPAPPANPFQDEANSAALKNLRQRFDAPGSDRRRFAASALISGVQAVQELANGFVDQPRLLQRRHVPRGGDLHEPSLRQALGDAAHFFRGRDRVLDPTHKQRRQVDLRQPRGHVGTGGHAAQRRRDALRRGGQHDAMGRLDQFRPALTSLGREQLVQHPVGQKSQALGQHAIRGGPAGFRRRRSIRDGTRVAQNQSPQPRPMPSEELPADVAAHG